jgi:hypothetical protein
MYILKVVTTLTLDNFTTGQDLNQLTESDDQHEIEADSTRDAIEQYYTSIGLDPCYDNVEGHIMHTTHLVDIDHLEPTLEEVEAWQKDELDLYALDISVSIYTYKAEEI